MFHKFFREANAYVVNLGQAGRLPNSWFQTPLAFQPTTDIEHLAVNTLASTTAAFGDADIGR